jgi:5'-phosphate synthase pdxT subunit
VKIGVLALQGDFALHTRALAKCRSGEMAEIETVEVRKPEELEGLDGLVMPGGESTTLLKLMEEWRFGPALEKFHEAGKPIFGTCAGLILLARDVESPHQASLGFIDVGVERNAYGRQRESFSAEGEVELDGTRRRLEMVFIRAPRIRRMGPGVVTLARRGDEPVMVREGTVLVATFHPELTADASVHRYFCDMVAAATRRNSA